MIGPIRGRRLSPEVKLRIVRAIASAKQQGMAVEHACEVILLGEARKFELISAQTAKTGVQICRYRPRR